jgi:hypothetical protein
MIRHRPVAIAGRDGHGMAMEIAVAAKLVVDIPILSEDGALVGLCTRDGICFWDVRPTLNGPRVADVETRKALASTGKLVASVDERGRAVAMRVEARHKTPPIPRGARRRTADDVEYFERPGGRILSVGGRPVRRWAE